MRNWRFSIPAPIARVITEARYRLDGAVNSLAVARPIPLEPPVMITYVPANIHPAWRSLPTVQSTMDSSQGFAYIRHELCLRDSGETL